MVGHAVRLSMFARGLQSVWFHHIMGSSGGSSSGV